MRRCTVLIALLGSAAMAAADSTYHSLFGSNFSQDWTNVGLLTTANDWSGVLSVEGYRGDDLTTVTGTDPQTIVAFAGPPGAVINLLPNQTNPNTFATGGVAEFEITNPTVALNGSGTADAPFVIFYLNTTNVTNIMVNYLLRDIDGSVDNSVQPVALQYRIGNSGDFTNLPGGFVADASTGPSLAVQETPVSVLLPIAAENQAQVQVRVMTTNAVGNDEWIGVDNVLITSSPVPEPATFAVLSLGILALRRRRK